MAQATELEPRSARLKRVVVGRPMSSAELEETLLPKWLALPIFASDPLSSVAYATEAALVVLVAASASSAHLVFPISLAIAALLAIVVLSYRQTVLVYESSGGAYVVAKDNLGRVPSLVAAAALLTDYVLTVAVSVAAGVLALTSAVAVLRGHELTLALVCVLLIAVANLRGVKEAGLLFALPTYAFVTSIFMLIGVGLTKCATSGCPQAAVQHPAASGTGALTLFIVLRAFASGSTALTGVEAIANGVNAFRRPHGRNAATTLAVLGTIAIAMFVGVSWLAVQMHAKPSNNGTPSVLAEIARGVFPSSSTLGFMYWAVQVLTLAVLVLAANTSLPGVPAPRRAAGARRLLRPAVRQPRRPARLLERDHRPDGHLLRAAVGLQRQRRLADPPLRDRRLHCVHALASRDGALLAAHPRAGLASPHRDQPGRSVGDRPGHRDRGLDEVRGRGVARDRRDPGARRVLPRHPPSLPPLRTTVERRCRGRSGGASADERGLAGGRVDRRRDRRSPLVRAADRRRARHCGRCSRRAGTRIPGSGRAGGTSRRSSLGSSRLRRRKARRRPCSKRCGACRAANPTS